jgi:hypothetical protein
VRERSDSSGCGVGRRGARHGQAHIPQYIGEAWDWSRVIGSSWTSDGGSAIMSVILFFLKMVLSRSRSWENMNERQTWWIPIYHQFGAGLFSRDRHPL